MATREQQLEQRITELEITVAQLIRATQAAVGRLGGNAGFGVNGDSSSNGWGIWQRLGADHDALVSLHGQLQRHPAPSQG